MQNNEWIIFKSLVVMAAAACWIMLGALLSTSIPMTGMGPIRVCGSIG